MVERFIERLLYVVSAVLLGLLDRMSFAEHREKSPRSAAVGEADHG